MLCPCEEFRGLFDSPGLVAEISLRPLSLFGRSTQKIPDVAFLNEQKLLIWH